MLQNASARVSESGDFGSFAFLPVTDGDFVQALPSKQLLKKAVNGKRLLLGVYSERSKSNEPLLTLHLE